jgi:hypothetical protein
LKKGEAIEALEAARAKGHTRYLGYSGDSHAARFAIECGAFDSLQTSINIADQEALDLTLPLAREKKIGLIAKRPVANVAWKRGHRPSNSYHQTYWDRLQKLRYPFLQSAQLEKSVATASASLSACRSLQRDCGHEKIQRAGKRTPACSQRIVRRKGVSGNPGALGGGRAQDLDWSDLTGLTRSMIDASLGRNLTSVERIWLRSWPCFS